MFNNIFATYNQIPRPKVDIKPGSTFDITFSEPYFQDYEEIFYPSTQESQEKAPEEQDDKKEGKKKTRARRIATESLLKLDIEDLLRQEGITSINGKEIRFGDRSLRPSNSSVGVERSHHKESDPHTGYANARDISIANGTDQDYADFRAILLGNNRIRSWFQQKNWGILNELTPEIMSRTRATGRHFHFGPDQSALRTWNTWLSNPNLNITQIV